MADNQTNPNSTGETAKNPQKSFHPANGDAVTKAGLWRFVAELVLAGAVGTGMWVFGEHLISHNHSVFGGIINFMAFCIYFATVPITAVKIWPRPMLVWASFLGFCVIMALVFTLSSRSAPELKPHFTVSMQIGDSISSKIVLTNQYLYRTSEVGVITNLSNGFEFLKGLPVAFIIIPMQPRQSNTVFHFVAKNDSPLAVMPLEMMLAFPKDWKLGVDSEKWHEATMGLFGGGYEVDLTNFQTRIARCPFFLYPQDWVSFPPITNFDSPIWHGASTKIESFRMLIRSPEFEESLMANFVFMQAPSNYFKPFLIPAVPETNGDSFVGT